MNQVDYDDEKCLTCDGQGIVPAEPESFDEDGKLRLDDEGNLQAGAPCPDCDGSGRRY